MHSRTAVTKSRDERDNLLVSGSATRRIISEKSMKQSRSIAASSSPSTDARPVGNPLALPRWAPAFAAAGVRRDGNRWIITSGEQELSIRVRVSRELGTVDFLAADAPRGAEVGAFSRVIPNGRGCEYHFTRFFADDETDDAVAEQMRVVEKELRSVRSLCEG